MTGLRLVERHPERSNRNHALPSVKNIPSLMDEIKHPIQPLYLDENGTLRFKENAIVRFLLDNGPFDLDTLSLEKFSQEDREQFAQLIGYSLGGYDDLKYVSDETRLQLDSSKRN